MDTIAVNGPEGVFDWDAIVWRTHEVHVARVRPGTFKAAREHEARDAVRLA